MRKLFIISISALLICGCDATDSSSDYTHSSWSSTTHEESSTSSESSSTGITSWTSSTSATSWTGSDTSWPTTSTYIYTNPHSGQVIEYDFRTRTADYPTADGKAPYLDKVGSDGEGTDKTLGFFNVCAKSGSPEGLLVAAENASASSGVDEVSPSSAWRGANGLVKMGTSKKEGVISLTFSETISKVEILCHDFFKKDSSHTTNSNKLDVNGDTQLLPYTETPTPGTLTFNLSEPSEDVVITSTGLEKEGTAYGRAFLFDIKVTIA